MFSSRRLSSVIRNFSWEDPNARLTIGRPKHHLATQYPSPPTHRRIEGECLGNRIVLPRPPRFCLMLPLSRPPIIWKIFLPCKKGLFLVRLSRRKVLMHDVATGQPGIGWWRWWGTAESLIYLVPCEKHIGKMVPMVSSTLLSQPRALHNICAGDPSVLPPYGRRLCASPPSRTSVPAWDAIRMSGSGLVWSLIDTVEKKGLSRNMWEPGLFRSYGFFLVADHEYDFHFYTMYFKNTGLYPVTSTRHTYA